MRHNRTSKRELKMDPYLEGKTSNGDAMPEDALDKMFESLVHSPHGLQPSDESETIREEDEP